jgi:4-aminobutyrate aminotransferase-like enzyme
MHGKKEILALNAFDGSSLSTMDAALQDAVERRLRSFGAASVLFYEEPLRMERAEGVWMFDAEGRSYLDLYNNVPSVGHSHSAAGRLAKYPHPLSQRRRRFLCGTSACNVSTRNQSSGPDLHRQ